MEFNLASRDNFVTNFNPTQNLHLVSARHSELNELLLRNQMRGGAPTSSA